MMNFNSHTEPPPSPTTPNPNNTFSTPSMTASRAANSPAFAHKLRQMALPLAPLVQLTTGHVHPAFPDTLLNFWLLTDDQLEDLAHFYHQRTPGPWTRHYPCPVPWGPGMSLEDKRRRIGRFIGLRGCDTPVVSHFQGESDGLDRRYKTEEELIEEARRARVYEDGDSAMRRKMGWH